MLFPNITVFTHNIPPEKAVQVITRLRTIGLEPFVDGLNHALYGWFDTNFRNCSHRFFNFCSGKVFTMESLVPEMLNYKDTAPQLVVSYPTDCLTDQNWIDIINYLKHAESNCPPEDVRQFLGMPASFTAAAPQIEGPDLSGEYAFDMHVEQAQDTALCQVSKPNTDRPYTVVVRGYSKRGLEPFFAGLFAVSSWGVSTADVAFLRELWVYLSMPGEFDIDDILKRATEACYPSDKGPGDPEPEVYRLTIQETQNQLSRKFGLFN